MRLLLLSVLSVLSLAAADPAGSWRDLFNGRNLDGWESRGDGVWVVLTDGTLVGERLPNKTFPQVWPMDRETFHRWLYRQAWLYTTAEFDEFDLRLDYWLRSEGNSGISIRDKSRAAYATGDQADFRRTPARIAYEIQLSNGYPDKHPSGSIYTFVDAPTGLQKDDQWNTIEIQSRRDGIRVLLNGQKAAEHPGDPARSKTGPIGLQLHDQYSVAQFRHIRIREIKR